MPCASYYATYQAWLAQAGQWRAQAQQLNAAGQDPSHALNMAMQCDNAAMSALAEYQACVARKSN
jgi:hypothetical protein